jgi:hypothetical protein
LSFFLEREKLEDILQETLLKKTLKRPWPFLKKALQGLGKNHANAREPAT